jgi:hypothetical protein
MAKSKYPHIEWADLNNEGTLTEVAVMRRDAIGNMYFVRLDVLDEIDKKRLFKIVTNRNAELYELWDLMSNVTLGNGVNALTYFHQLVKVRTPGGKVMTPTSGVMGAPLAPKAPATATAPAADANPNPNPGE